MKGSGQHVKLYTQPFFVLPPFNDEFEWLSAEMKESRRLRSSSKVPFSRFWPVPYREAYPISE